MDHPLKPGEWIDDLPEPLDSAGDVEDLFRIVEEKQAELRAAAIGKASKN